MTKIRNLKMNTLSIAIDSTGIKITNRGQWMKDKWKVKKERIFKNTYSSKHQEQENSFDEGNR